VVFGRDGERARIERLLDALPDGTVGLALEGTPGVGKTTVWREGVTRGGERGYTVLSSSPAEPDAALAFSGLGDLFDAIPEAVIARLSAPQRQALDAALFAGDGGGPGSAVDPGALPRATLNLLRQLAVARPLLVAIDDEQWLDRPSARVLGFALCRLRDEPVGVLLTRRVASDGALWPELSRGFGTDGLRAVGLEPLHINAIGRLLSAELDRPISPPLLRRIYETSAGNPLYALAIGRELGSASERGLGGQQVPIPQTLADAIARRLGDLDARAADPLLVAAAASNPTLALIQSVLPEFALNDLDGAERAQVIEIAGDRVRFTHPLLASTTYSLAPTQRRRELHRSLAEVVSDEEERAQHLALGAEAPERELAFTIEHAAGRATRRGAPEVAAQLLEQAARLTPADATHARRSRTIAAAEQYKAAGALDRARALLEMVLGELPVGPVRARALAQLAELRTDDYEIACALLEQALPDAGDHHRLAAQIEAQLAENRANRGDYAAAVEHGRAAVTRAEQARDPGLLAQMLAAYGVMAFFHGQGVQHEPLARAIELAEHDREMPSYRWPSTSLGLQLFWSDQLDPARPLLESSMRRAIERGEEYDRAAIAFHLAHLEWEAGNRELAEQLTAQATDAQQQVADTQADLYLTWLEAFCATRDGHLDRARTTATKAIELAARIGDNFNWSFATAILAETELWTGQAGRAHERLAPLRNAFRGTVVGSLTLPFWSYDIEALIALGRLEEADEIAADLLNCAREAVNPNAIGIAERCRGLLLAARGDIVDAIDAMDAALAQHALRPLPMELGRTLLETGTLQRRAKRKRAAKQSLEHALAILEPLQAQMWVARARDELGRVGLRRPAVSDGLTPAQQRVAELVLAGMSNRQIADTLYMSLRTVETHLTKIYRDLGVKSRAQLISTMSTTGSQHRTGDS
jgi:DNA-binding NarL/FixJ family response regulator